MNNFYFTQSVLSDELIIEIPKEIEICTHFVSANLNGSFNLSCFSRSFHQKNSFEKFIFSTNHTVIEKYFFYVMLIITFLQYDIIIKYSRSLDSDGIQSEHNCCNCGQKLLLSDDNEGYKEYNSIKVDECRPPSPKRSHAVNEDEDEDDEDFFHAPDLGTFYSDELCNYYLQNDGEEEMAFHRIYDQNAEAFKERIIPDTGFQCEIVTIDYSHSKKHSICDSSDVKRLNPSKRTIETVAEETSSIV